MTSSKRRLLFDTHAFLAFFNREEGSGTIRDLFGAVERGDAEGFVAAITLTEIVYIYARRGDAATGTIRAMQILHSKVLAVPLDPETALRAGRLKRPGISVADAIVVASAVSAGASVVTNDPHFAEMGVEVVGYP